MILVYAFPLFMVAAVVWVYVQARPTSSARSSQAEEQRALVRTPVVHDDDSAPRPAGPAERP